MAAHRRAFSHAQGALAGCPCRCAFVQRYLARDVERWEAELTWLEALAGEPRDRRGGGARDDRERGDPGAAWPVADLDVAEQFVLWALRTRLESAAKRSHLEHGFHLAHGIATGGAALAAFEPWFALLATHCWRDLYLHRAPCPCLSDDERAMLDLVASAQAGDEMRLYRLAAGLVHPRAIGFLQ